MAAKPVAADAFIEQLVAGGVRWVFGNPGTTEQPVLGRLGGHPAIGFVTALHEAVAVAAAEGYARATGEVGVVELHAGPGLGNGLGMLYNAAEGRTPLLVYVGQSEQRGLYQEPTLSGNFVAQAHPIAKWAYEVRTPDEVPQVTRRALKVAATEPCGPVVLSVPMDLLEEPCAGEVVAPSLVSTRVRPDPERVAAAAEVLARARRPAVLVGDGVARAGALAEVGELARLLGAPIYGAFMSEACVEPGEPLDAGRLPSVEGAHAVAALAPYDAVVAVGTKVLSPLFPVPGPPLGDRDVVHVGLDPWELAKNQPSVVVYGHERLALRDLVDALAPPLAPRADDLRARRLAVEAELASARRRAREADRRRWDERPMTAERAVAELAARTPDDAILVDESLTAFAAVARYFTLRPGQWFRLRGGGIGAGMPMAVGVQLAHPDRPVVALVGDGSAIYTISAMWTAAHHRLPVTWVILNNRGYRILKENARREGGGPGLADRLVGADLTEPALDFVSLARGMGVRAERVGDPDRVGDAVAAAVAADQPVLLDLEISGTPGR